MTDTQPSMPARLELPVRAASGVVMGVAAVAALVSGGLLFAVFVALAAIAALREWHRLVNGGRFARELVPTGVAAIAVVWLASASSGVEPALIAIVLGAAGAALAAATRRMPALAHSLACVRRALCGPAGAGLGAPARRAAGRGDRRGRVCGGLDGRHGRAVVRPSDRRAEARARLVAEQDLGGISGGTLAAGDR